MNDKYNYNNLLEETARKSKEERDGKKEFCLVNACAFAAIAFVLLLVAVTESGEVSRNFTAAFIVVALVAFCFWAAWLISDTTERGGGLKYYRLKRNVRKMLRNGSAPESKVYSAFLLIGNSCGVDRARLERDFERLKK